MSSGRQVLLLRHGQTSWNAAGRFQGQTDIDLDDVGRRQADRAAKHLARLSPSAIVSSDLRRAQDTAAALAQRTGLDVATDQRLREVYAGSWQGLVASEIDAATPELRRAWRSGEDVRPGGDGETRVELGQRVAEAVREHVGRVQPGQLLVVVTHGGSISNGVQTLLGVPREHWPVVSGVGNCHWTVLDELVAGRWVLSEHNAFSLPEDVVGDES
ncbi:histidine phosphatase family protein [Angustibacter sp. McL0619]|uniref:histidine phosphatase family protein n=1 Tax=Angustibacter sp. McL0619 TaxID=3415676 RepID=UPI003CF5AFCC